MATLFNLVSKDAQVALTEFSTAFDGALAAAKPENTWSRQFGFTWNGKFKATFPLPVNSPAFRLRVGDDKLRSLYEKSISCIPVEYADGFAEKASIVEAPDFIGWGNQPAAIANEFVRHPNVLAAAMLESNSGAGPTLEFDSLSLFNDSHPCNVFDSSIGTFDNNRSASAFDSVMIAGLRKYFRTIKAPNGKPMGLRLSHFIVPADLEETAKQFLESDLMYNAVLAGGDSSNTNRVGNNIYKGAVQLIVADELAIGSNVFYAIAGNGPAPWIVQDGGAPEEILYTKQDTLYKDQGKIGAKYIATMGVTATLAHSIARVHIGGSE